jgi:hypothetical protein
MTAPAGPPPMQCGYCHSRVRAGPGGHWFHTGVPASVATITRRVEPVPGHQAPADTPAPAMRGPSRDGLFNP